MSVFAVAVWNEFESDTVFERVIPLAFNGERMQALGIRNRIELFFLAGMNRLSERYRDRLRELGYRLHDCSKLAEGTIARFPLLQEYYGDWQRIRYFGLVRFLLFEILLKGESIITFDGDMVINASLDEIEDAVAGEFVVLQGSTCFMSIPGNSDALNVFVRELTNFQDNPNKYARRVLGLAKAKKYFERRQSEGSDQAWMLSLIRTGHLFPKTDTQFFLKHGIIGFANWLLVEHPAEPGRRLSYERRDGADYLNGNKVLMSHLSFDTCLYFGVFAFLQRLLGPDRMAQLGRVPIPLKHYEIGEAIPGYREFLHKLRLAVGGFGDLATLGVQPFNRAAVIEAFYRQGDFSSIMNDTFWHKAGIFE